MSFFRGLADTFRAVNEGRATANAHKAAEHYLGIKLPLDVAEDGFATVARMADFSSIEQMSMVYVIKYAQRMVDYLDSVNATNEFRLEVAKNVARACINLANLQRSGTKFEAFYVKELVEAAKMLGVKTDGEKISFTI